MIVLRRTHMHAFEDARTEAFLADMVRYARRHTGTETQPVDPGAAAVVRQWIQEAEELGATEISQVAAFVDLCVCFACLRNRRRPQWLARILARPGYSFDLRLLQLEDRLLFGDIPQDVVLL
jgi:hypothetical protein